MSRTLFRAQIKMQFVVMQNQANGSEVVFPPEVRTAEPIYPVPKYADR